MKDRTLDVLFALGIIIAVTTAIAAAALVPASGDVSVETNSGLIVEFQDVSQFESDPFVDDQTIRTTNGTISSAGTSRVETVGTDIGGSQRFNLTDQTTAVTVNKDDANAITVSGSVDDLTIDAGTAADENEQQDKHTEGDQKPASGPHGPVIHPDRQPIERGPGFPRRDIVEILIVRSRLHRIVHTNAMWWNDPNTAGCNSDIAAEKPGRFRFPTPKSQYALRSTNPDRTPGVRP